jgi:diaminopropionate ammonia-lyase
MVDQSTQMQVRILANPHVSDPMSPIVPDRAPLAFHRQLPGYAPTPLIDAPGVARRLGVARVLVKHESQRFGLPAFKVLGASWAIYRALQESLGSFDPERTIDDLRAQVQPLLPITLVAATDGNHGRAVARVGGWLGLSSRIYVPEEMVEARRAAIRGEGAELIVVHGSYEDAVARAAADANARTLVIADTAWEGYETVPRWVIDGYSTILWEIEDQLAELGAPQPDAIAAQMGVGALAAAITSHYRQSPSLRPRITGVEPATAACVLASIEADHLVEVPGPHGSIMAGLNCGYPSLVAWPTVSTGINQFVAIGDEWARESMRALAAEGIVAGETGGAGLAGLLAIASDPDARERAGLTPDATVLLIVSEGATDPEAYARIVG